MATMLVGRRDDEFVPAERRGLRGARRVPEQDGGGGAFYNCILFWILQLFNCLSLWQQPRYWNYIP